ncbi:MAG: fimbrillin family protein [Bacteroidaceae bacterium]
MNKRIHVANNLLLVVSMLLFSCQSDDGVTNAVANIPIQISENSSIQTRTINSSFAANDAIGLFVFQPPQTLSDERWVDNMQFVFDGSSWLPNQVVYYPTNTSASTFIAYYPYAPNLLDQAQSIASVTVAVEQDKAENYSRSDFLVAEKMDVFPSDTAVPLLFQHKMSRIEIQLLPGTAYASAADLLADDPVVVIRQVKCAADYDFKTALFSSLDEENNIIVNGDFEVKEEALVGKQAILIPQTIPENQFFMEVSVASGKHFSFSFGEQHAFEPATKQTLTLTMKGQALSTDLLATIAEWKELETYNGNLDEDGNDPVSPINDACFEINLPTFSDSYVYKVQQSDVDVAVICKEYIATRDGGRVAIVAYPMEQQHIDLANGFVVSLCEPSSLAVSAAAVHGGSLSWDSTTHLPTLIAGHSITDSHFYLSKKGDFSFHTTATSPYPTVVTPLYFGDAVAKNYPIAKIGTNFWMTTNFAALALDDDTTIEKEKYTSSWESNQNKGTKARPACIADFLHKGYLYNRTVATSSLLATNGWEMPTLNDWQDLNTYLNSDITLLMDCSWEDGSNLTAFSLFPTRFVNSSGEMSSDICARYWAMDENSVLFEEGEMEVCKYGVTYGASIRLLKKIDF